MPTKDFHTSWINSGLTLLFFELKVLAVRNVEKYLWPYSVRNLVGNVPDMSLGRGHVKKSQGQNQMVDHIFDRIFSVTCPSRVLRVSHMSDTLKKQRKRESKSIKTSKFLFGRLIRFHSKKFTSEIFLMQLQIHYWF